MTFCASTNHPIAYFSATLVFVDSEAESWNMNLDLLEEAIKDRIAKTGKKPKAIVPVTLYGMSYRIDKIMEIANRYEIPVIEDAAEGFGSRYNGQVLGTFGKYGVLSFNGNKMITTSGGGALVCDNEGDKNKVIKLLRNFVVLLLFKASITISSYRSSIVFCIALMCGEIPLKVLKTSYLINFIVLNIAS